MRSSPRLDLTEDAEDDLRPILEYTLVTWGAREHDVYADCTSGQTPPTTYPDERPAEHRKPVGGLPGRFSQDSACR
jgi:plasmid stabilization system protein ParE